MARLSTTGLNLFQSLPAAREFLLDGFKGRRPDEGFGMLIPHSQEFGDRLLQILHAVERIPTYPFGGQLGKPALDQIKPTGTGRHKMGDEARMSWEPSSNRRVFVSPVVVDHQVQRDRAGKFLIQTAQELQKLLVPVPFKALTDDPAL